MNNGSTLHSGYATITVFPPVQAGTLTPDIQFINYNTLSDVMTLSGYSGGNSAYSFQWQASPTSNGIYEDVGAGAAAFREDTPLQSTKYYRVIVTSNGVSATSNSVLVSVHPQLIVGSINPAALSIYENTNPGDLSLTEVSGGFGPYTYEWQQSANSTFLPRSVVGHNLPVYHTIPLSETSYYRVVVTSNGVSVASNYALITVYPTLIPGTITPANQTRNYNTTVSSLALSATSGGNGSYTYQWQSSSNSTFNNPVNVGEGSTTYEPSNLVSKYYRVLVTSAGLTLPTASAHVTVHPRLNPGTVDPSISYITSGSSAPGLFDDGVNGGDESQGYSYRWESSPDNDVWSLIGGATTLGYDPGVLYSNMYYRLRVTNNGVTVWTPPASVIIYNLAKSGVITTPTLTLDAGMDAGTIKATAASEGACNGNYQYEWQKSINGTVFTGTGVIAQNYSPGVVNSTTWYRRKVTCGPDILFTNSMKVVIESLSTHTDFNYLRTRDILKENVTTRSSADALTNAVDVQQTTQYYDGIGRPMQTVQRQASPQLKDVVTVQTYDQFDREARQYLPYASGSSQTGNIKLTPLSDQQNFNAAQFPGELHYSSAITYEASPLSRMTANYAPGISWVGSQRGVTSQYLFNVAADGILKWNAVGGGTPENVGPYIEGVLIKSITTDEASQDVIEFKDKEGRTVCKKVKVDATSYASTYYIYDDSGNLVVVLPPEAVKRILSGN